jgi:hypothetical protein
LHPVQLCVQRILLRMFPPGEDTSYLVPVASGEDEDDQGCPSFLLSRIDHAKVLREYAETSRAALDPNMLRRLSSPTTGYFNVHLGHRFERMGARGSPSPQTFVMSEREGIAIETFLEERECFALNNAEEINKLTHYGVYAIYYVGGERDRYPIPLDDWWLPNAYQPVFVGKASDGNASIYSRLRHHCRCLRDLKIAPNEGNGQTLSRFLCATVTTTKASATLFEQQLIEHYQPIFNCPTTAHGGMGFDKVFREMHKDPHAVASYFQRMTLL